MTRMTIRRRSDAGYNLVEVLIAMALLGVVTISIFTLFYMGRKNVYSGKQTSQAVAIATEAIEDLSALNKTQIYNGAFGINATSTGGAFTIPAAQAGGQVYSYTNSNIRSTNSTFIASPPVDIATENSPPGLLAKWTGLLGTKFARGSVTLVLTPDADPVNNPPQYGTATVLRCRVIVRWLESGRGREVVIDTVKAY